MSSSFSVRSVRSALGRARTDVGALVRLPTASSRPLPGFLVLGAQKCGTSTLHASLCTHPRILGPITKELHHFDRTPRRGERWYRAHFPRTPRGAAAGAGGAWIAGEASPYYLVSPPVPARVRAALPDAKLLVILRDPVRRAVSGYHHAVRFGFEDRPIQVALDPASEPPMPAENDPVFDRRDAELRRRGYLARGRYGEQLARWFAVFPRERFLVLESGDLRRDGLDRAREHLGVAPDPAMHLVDRNVRAYPDPPDEVVERLQAYYAPHNAALWELLGSRWEWSS